MIYNDVPGYKIVIFQFATVNNQRTTNKTDGCV